uniref:non-specific serine/threonine protein kinase n=1 Tax=Blastobotrys adeninivorans TaxID=409370 RepID=A0A060TC74_BLAAD
MSLVTYNGSGNLRVVLQDQDRHALVLYDGSSRKLTLVNDPSTFRKLQNTLPEWQNRLRHRPRRVPRRCSACGQTIESEPESPTPRLLSLLDESAGSGAVNSNGGVEGGIDGSVGGVGAGGIELPRVMRDANYFRLLDLADSDQRQEERSISESAFSPGYFEKFFVSKAQLGRGSRGAVYLVEHVLDGVSLGLFALKKVPVGNDHEWLEKVLAEVHLLRVLSHPNLVSYNYVWLENSSVSAFGPQVPCAFILQEYCNGGTLEDYVRLRQKQGRSQGAQGKMSKRERLRRQSLGLPLDDYSISSMSQLLTVQEILAFMVDIVSGVRHLHKHQIIHRDLKPSNCLMSVPQNGSSLTDGLPTILVSDFGEGQLEGRSRDGTGSTGTLEYCAPELVREGHMAQFSKSTDMFSLGMILHFLCFSRLPYSHNPWEERVDIDQLKLEVEQFRGYNPPSAIGGGLERDDLPPALLDLLRSMLSVDASQRPSTDEVIDTLVTIDPERKVVSIEEGEWQLTTTSTTATTHIATTNTGQKDSTMASLITNFTLTKPQYYLFKSALAMLKLVTMSRVGIPQLGWTLFGLELATNSLKTTIALSACHLALCLVPPNISYIDYRI